MKLCERCSANNHEKCVTRDSSVKESRCGCGCVGNPFVGIVCVTEEGKEKA